MLDNFEQKSQELLKLQEERKLILDQLNNGETEHDRNEALHLLWKVCGDICYLLGNHE